MSTQWRLFLTALRFDTRLLSAALDNTDVAYPGAAARYVPIAGALLGAVGGGVYWLAAQLWPTSIAVVLSLLATTVMSGAARGTLAAERPADESNLNTGVRASGMVALVFALLLKYNVLMALSAANLPFAVPANTALALIMICGHAASHCLVISLIASSARASSTPVSNVDLSLALGVGLAPAALLGIPGLIGLVAAILACAVFLAYLKRDRKAVAGVQLYAAQQVTEICFYLAALASWTYV
jgi:adenosylcobinamide-GDP ribazoletransferase